MNVLIAPDKFKGTLTAERAAWAIARGWRRARPDDTLEVLPISDGGDGFGAALASQLGATPHRAATVDAAHRRCTARWWWEPASRTAIIESAKIIGLAMLPPRRFHPFELDTFGLGAVLQAALRHRPGRIVIGLGGSATNDGGFGMARALGWRFLDRRGRELTQWTALHALWRLEPPATRLNCRVIAAVDVENPLLGRRGATRIFGPQKGLRPEDFPRAERCLRRLAAVARRQLGQDFAARAGAGAAGGLGFGLAAFCHGQLVAGFELFSRLAGLETRLRRADLVLTGEGALDHSTLMGKGVGQLARRCLSLGKPCIALAGTIGELPAGLWFRAARALTELTSLEAAKAAPARWLERLAARIAREWTPGR
ncbi:MAG: glycerate kinase [Verrucomicrobiae bacterium]|nr:glycerate kinase [Verrucomicrobiae bacterium]MDW8308942.1 glycerate kinase [Verrucomicrobiales bacterium]